MLSLSNDKHLMAAWEAYSVMHDEEDFADTLQVLCEVKRQKNGSQQEQMRINEGFGIQMMGGQIQFNEPHNQIISNRDSEENNK